MRPSFYVFLGAVFVISLAICTWAFENHVRSQKHLVKEPFEVMRHTVERSQKPLHEISIDEASPTIPLPRTLHPPFRSNWVLEDATKQAFALVHVTDALSASLASQTLVLCALPHRRVFTVLQHTPDKAEVRLFDRLVAADVPQRTRMQVAYVRDAERTLFEQIAFAHGVRDVHARFELVQVPNLEAWRAAPPSMLLACLVPDATYESDTLRFLRSMSGHVTVYDYKSTSQHDDKFAFFAPFGESGGIDFRRLYPNHARFYRIVPCLAFQLIATTQAHPQHPAVQAYLDAYLPRQLEETSYMSMFFRVHPRIQARVQETVRRQGQGVEPFANSPPLPRAIAIAPPEPVEGESTLLPSDGFKSLRVRDAHGRIQGFPVKVGDRVTLQAQRFRQENGAYWVVLSDASTGDVLLATHPMVELKNVSVIQEEEDGSIVFSGVAVGDGLDWPGLAPNLQFFIPSMKRVAEWIRMDDRGRWIFRSQNAATGGDGRGKVGEKRGVCYTDPTLQNKEACESAFDGTGNRKPRGPDVWDTPCQTDTDCPFFRANTRYPNVRGGCHNGFCEMPVGVRRLAYRVYEESEQSFPYCHNCPTWNPSCCAEQKEPDYAFPNDLLDRARGGAKIKSP